MIQTEKKAPTMLLILDGFGYRREKDGNAIANAKMPTWHSLVQRYPHTLLMASGRAVGLPDGYMGNSEVGHLCMGAGRIVPTILSRFNDAIDDGSFFSNKIILEKLTQLKNENKPLHLIGLLSDAGVHSHTKHLFVIIEIAKKVGLKSIFIHVILDGRDTPPKSAKKYLQELENYCEEQKVGKIASIHGRFYAMDRDENWKRTEKSYNVLTGDKPGSGKPGSDVTWQEVLDQSYRQEITDEFVEPVLLDGGKTIRQDDGVFFFNFRSDRARQLTQCFINSARAKFPLSFFLTTTCFDKTFTNDILFESEHIEHTLLDVLAAQANNKKVFIIAETEKYAHVTYFFRGKRDVQLDHETRVLVPSIKAKTYIDYPEMSAPTITEKLVDSLQSDPASFYLVNFANADMVGHSGNFEAVVKTCECLDEQLKILYEHVVDRLGGTIFLTADHGNAEEMVDLETGTIKTSHTTNPVPFIVINKQLVGEFPSFDKQEIVPEYGLSTIAPTILRFLGLVVPTEMEQGTIEISGFCAENKGK